MKGMTEQEKREKAIEEMAVIGCVRNPQAHTSEECEVCCFKEGKCNAYRHATKLYDTGWRKVPCNAVVLPEDEYTTLVSNAATAYDDGFEDGRKECDKNAYNAWKGIFGLKEKVIREEERKETAKEIADWLDNNVFRIKEFREFLKRKFGVEVEE